MQRCSVALYVTCVLVSGAATLPAFAQHKVDARHLYERMLTRVPMVGKGTFDEPQAAAVCSSACGNSSRFQNRNYRIHLPGER